MKDYWHMSDEELEDEAVNHNIGGIWVTSGNRTYLDRQAAITPLLERDNALNSTRSDTRNYNNFTITGSAVTFGDGATINLSTVTLGDILWAALSEIEGKVTDPTEKKTLRDRVAEILKHPAWLVLMQTGIPELLRRL